MNATEAVGSYKSFGTFGRKNRIIFEGMHLTYIEVAHIANEDIP
jgi:hypothetical protein